MDLKLIKRALLNMCTYLGVISSIVTILGAFSFTSKYFHEYFTPLLFKRTIIFIIIFVIIYIIHEVFCKKVRIKTDYANIIIKRGNILKEKGKIVIPFNEYFDTIVDDEIITSESLNGMYIQQRYNKNPISNLDTKIADKLKEKHMISKNNSRPKGKKKKYELGTTIQVDKRFILTALTHFNKNNNAYISNSEYIETLIKFWNQLDIIYQGYTVSIPLLGSGITRFTYPLTKQEILGLILLTFKMSRKQINLQIIIYKTDYNDLNLDYIK